jgi:hypothetical protein
VSGKGDDLNFFDNIGYGSKLSSSLLEELLIELDEDSDDWNSEYLLFLFLLGR